MNLKTKRIYETPASSDGTRVLIDRLWPRGISKANAHIDEWPKDIAPSNELRKWFHEDAEKRFNEFKKRYHGELKENTKAVKDLFSKLKGTVTLVSAVTDFEHSHVSVLKEFIEHL